MLAPPRSSLARQPPLSPHERHSPGPAAYSNHPPTSPLHSNGALTARQEVIQHFIDLPALVAPIGNAGRGSSMDPETASLLEQKIAFAAVLFNFPYPADAAQDERDGAAIVAKRQCLVELINFVTEYKGTLTLHRAKQFVEMIGLNLIRALPPSRTGINFDPNEDAAPNDPAFVHVGLAYELLLRLLQSSKLLPAKVAKSAGINAHFARGLMRCFENCKQ